MSPVATHPLDNVAWHALVGPHRTLGERLGKAARFDADVSPFAAVEDSSPDAWADLAQLVGPGGVTSVFAASLDLPDWELIFAVACGQLVAEHVTTDGESEGVVELGPDDVPDMLSLVEATQPGPFGPRTVELGGYVVPD